MRKPSNEEYTKLNIVFILSTGKMQGGASTVFCSIIPGMSTELGSVCVLTRNGCSDLSEWFKNEGIDSRAIGIKWWCQSSKRGIIKRNIIKIIKKPVHLLMELVIAYHAKRINADLIVVFDGVIGSGYRAAKWLGIPSIGYLQEVPTLGLGISLDSEVVVRRYLGGAKAAIAISDFVANWWKEYLDNTPIFVIPNGWAQDKVYSNEREYCSNGVVQISMMGSFSIESKGHERLIEAVSKLIAKGENRFSIRMYGNGIGSQRGKHLARLIGEYSLEEKVLMLPYNHSVSEIYGNTDIIVSCCENEGFGLTILEGMASGCLAVGPDAGGVRGLIAEGRGIEYRSGDTSDLAIAIETAIEKMLTDPLNAISKGRSFARSLTAERQAREVLSIIEASAIKE